jgi:predicted phosphatase
MMCATTYIHVVSNFHIETKFHNNLFLSFTMLSMKSYQTLYRYICHFSDIVLLGHPYKRTMLCQMIFVIDTVTNLFWDFFFFRTT